MPLYMIAHSACLLLNYELAGISHIARSGFDLF